MRKLISLMVLSLACVVSHYPQQQPQISQGSLYAATAKGNRVTTCVLKSTAVRADISGFITRVRVTQEFENTFKVPVEAIYTFPLSQNAAVDDMTMKIGDRTIVGKILKKEEAREVYESAKKEGKIASLLDQDRPNMFTQAVANIMPGEKIVIEISYVETLKFDEGSYEFVFPMTITPRYQPAGGRNRTTATSNPVAATRPGHDISIEVNLNTGVPVEDIRSSSHSINALNLGSALSKVTLQTEKTIPNKDFVLKFDVIGKRMEDAVLFNKGENGGFFSLILSPPERMSSEDMTPKEIVFVLDTSGSMSGFPIEKAKESMKLALDGLYPDDTFNLITFAGDTAVLFDQPVPATRANLDATQQFLAARQGYGGTEMMAAIRAALEPSDAADHLRIVCFMTDGAVGNDMEIIAEVKKHPNARVFSFGIGGSVNRFLLDNIAKEGRGEAEYVMLEDDGSRAAKRFHERIRNPYLTDISIDWAGLPITDVYPKRIPDLFGAKPIVIYGRYNGWSSGKVKLKGAIGGQPFEREITLDLPATEPANGVLSTLWARTKVDELMSQNWNIHSDTSEPSVAVQNEIIKLGVDHRIMTQFTSFVAVEERVVNAMGDRETVRVPNYAPAGTAVDITPGLSASNGPHGFIGQLFYGRRRVTNVTNSPATVNSVTLSKVSGGVLPNVAATPMPPRIISGGVLNGKGVSLSKPTYPSAALAVKASGPVQVQVEIDEAGKVIAAKAVSGHPLLRASAEKAALNSTFQPTMLSGVPVKVSGVISYAYGAGSATTILGRANSVSTKAIEDLTPSELRLFGIAVRTHFWIYDLIQRLEKGSKLAGSNELMFVRDGKARVKIELTAKTAAAMEKLIAAGLVVESETASNIVIGRIAIEKLAALAEIDDVKLILPNV